MTEIPLRIRQEMHAYFEKHRIPEEKKKHIENTVREVYRRSLYDPEEAIGVVCAQSLSEPATQMTMRTYHFAGTAGIQVTLGLPRLIEIFDAKKEPETPSMTIHLMNDHQTEAKAVGVAKRIKEVKLKDFVMSDVIDLINMGITCRLDVPKLAKFDLKKEDLPKHIRIKDVGVEVKGDSLVVTSKKQESTNLHKLKYKVMESHIKGVKDISHVIVSKDTEGRWIITTLGSNLKKVLTIDGVDSAKTFSNNIFEIYEVFGVEAARNAIIQEAVGTIEEQGLGVDVRYVSLLADLMTSNGAIMGIGRYGIAGNKNSVLARMAFEETKKHIITASVEGIKDPLKGHVENIIMNQLIRIGTGAFDLVGRFPGAEELKRLEENKKEQAVETAEAGEAGPERKTVKKTKAEKKAKPEKKAPAKKAKKKK